VETSCDAGSPSRKSFIDFFGGEEPIALPYDVVGPGPFDIRIRLEGDVIFEASARLEAGSLHRADFGALLPAPGLPGDAALWWASSGWKISRSRPPPTVHDRALLVRLALDLQALRRSPTGPRGQARREAAGRLGKFLALEAERADLVLSALGWPPGDEAHVPEQSASAPEQDPRRREGILAAADRDEPWQVTRRRLEARFGLGGDELRGVRARLCRRAVRRAFGSPGSADRALDALARLADLAPAQGRAVLAMEAARRLSGGAPQAFTELIALLGDPAAPALPLIEEWVCNAGVPERALRAAQALDGPESPRAPRTLQALGPFGLDALNVVGERRGWTERAAELRARLEAAWGPDANALETLGRHPNRWRRWWRGAREVLSTPGTALQGDSPNAGSP
jgi:hypothetical protein